MFAAVRDRTYYIYYVYRRILWRFSPEDYMHVSFVSCETDVCTHVNVTTRGATIQRDTRLACTWEKKKVLLIPLFIERKMHIYIFIKCLSTFIMILSLEKIYFFENNIANILSFRKNDPTYTIFIFKLFLEKHFYCKKWYAFSRGKFIDVIKDIIISTRRSWIAIFFQFCLIIKWISSINVY